MHQRTKRRDSVCGVIDRARPQVKGDSRVREGKHGSTREEQQEQSRAE